MDDPIVRGKVCECDESIIHHSSLITNRNGQRLAFSGRQGHAVCQISGHVNSRNNVIFERGNHVIERKHVKLPQVHQIHEIRDGYIGRDKNGVSLIAIEIEVVVGASKSRTEIRVERIGALPAIEIGQISFSVLDINQDVHQGVGIYGDGSNHAQGFLHPDAGAEVIDSRRVQCDDAHAKPLNIAF